MPMLQWLLITFVLFENAFGDYLWLNGDILEDVPPYAKEMIRRKHKEFCTGDVTFKDMSKDGGLLKGVWRRGSACWTFNDLLKRFKKRVNKSTRRYLDYWNGDAMKILNKHFQGEFVPGHENGFTKLPKDFGKSHLVHMFDPIDKESTSDYRLPFADIAGLAFDVDKAISESPQSIKLEKLQTLLRKINEDIDSAANNVESSKSWQLSKLYNKPNGKLYENLSLCKSTVSSHFPNYRADDLKDLENHLMTNPQSREEIRLFVIQAVEKYLDILSDLFEEAKKPSHGSSLPRSGGNHPQRSSSESHGSRRSHMGASSASMTARSSSHSGHMGASSASIATRSSVHSGHRAGSYSQRSQGSQITTPQRSGSQSVRHGGGSSLVSTGSTKKHH